MSLLKLLFDLPEAGGESNFTVEEQEELMQFEHNLDERLVENFALPTGDDRIGLSEAGGIEDGACNDAVAVASGLPVGNGAYPGHVVEMANGIEVKEGLAPLLNGHIFGRSTIDHFAHAFPHIVAPMNQEAPKDPGLFDKTGAAQKAVELSAESTPEQMPAVPTVESSSATLPARTPASATGERAVGCSQEIAPAKKYDISSKHQDTGKAVWIKWRGKWQAAIQVRVEDCRAATVKAMPTYGKKEYIPVYLVTNRSYIWIDAQNICDINARPEPLLSGTHEEWCHLVVDTGAPRRRTFLSLGWEMLDISDRLHIMGVVERARFVSVWKEFAKEASEAAKYSELGSLLVRIYAVVEPDYVRQSWVEKRLKAWVEECSKAETAVTIEKLIKECMRVILWDKAAKLWEAPEQPVLDPGWADWKGPAFDELMDPEDDADVPADKPSRPTSSSSLTPKTEKEGISGAKRGRPSKSKEGSDRSQPAASAGRVTTRKQVKVEKHYDAGPSSSSAMERFPAASEPVAHCSQTLAFSVDATKSEFAVEHTLETKVVASELHLKGQGSGVKLSQDGPLNSASKTWKWKFKSDAWGCSAFLKNKKRRCPRQAWKGIYCEKHQGLAENPSVADPNVEPSNLCMARYWVENRRCANSVVEGSYYCVMHADCRPPKSVDSGVVNDTKDDLKGDNDKVMMAKHLRCTGVTVQDTQPTNMMKDGQNHSIKLAEQDPGQGGSTLATTVNGDGAMVNIEQRGRQLSGRPAEKPLKSAASNANGGSKTSGSLGDQISDKNLGKLIANMNVKERRNFLKAQDLLCKYMNEGLSKDKGGNEEVQGTKMIDFIIDETTKDLPSGEMLLKILRGEKERLAKMMLGDGSTRTGCDIDWLRGAGSQSGNILKLEMGTPSNGTSAWQLTTSPVQDEVKEAGLDTGYLCCLCGHKFEQLSMLGKHWKELHKREAQLFEKYLLCRICDKGGPMFGSKLSLVKHWRTAHPTVAMSSPGWSVCLMCDKECLDFDHLWQHVEDMHHSHWSSADFAGRVKASRLSRKNNKCSFCSETFNTYWEVQQHHENVHKDEEILHSGTKRNRDAMDSEVIGNNSKRVDVTVAESTYKFNCRHCSMKFQLLPDLGRHHQAEHKGLSEGSARGQSSSGGTLSIQKKKTKEEEVGSDWHAVPIGREGTDKDGNAKKWRYRARTKTKNSTRGRSAPIKKQSGGAEAILQRMRAVKQVLEDQKTKRPPRKRDRKAERARRLAKLAGISGTPAPIAAKFKCRFCGLEFALLVDLTRHHQAEHSAVKQAFIINGRGEVQTGIYTLTKDGIIGPLQGELLDRPPNSKELLEVARSTCCKDWFFNELGKRYAQLPPRLFVQAAHLCSEAKLEIRWHQDKYLCPDGCKSYSASHLLPSSDMDLGAFAKSSSNVYEGDGKGRAVGALDLLTSSNNAVYKGVIISEDLSNGLEKVPIRCVMDGDVMEPCTCSLCTESGSLTSPGVSQPWKNFVYITKRHLDPSLGLDTKSSQVGCSCTEDKCSASSCDHVSMFDTDNAEACTIDGNPIRGQFPYDKFGRIILDVGYMVYECNSICQCKDSCQNRVLQKGVRLKLEVFKSRHKGWGVRAAEAILRGTFVCEYIGEVLNDSEANERGKRYDQLGCSYLYNIDAHLDVIGPRSGSKPFVIDATKCGNVARFINHSCEPNLINYEVLVESMDCQLAHIGFFAKRDIAMGEELAYDYRYKLLPGKGCPCHCGAPNCRGRLY